MNLQANFSTPCFNQFCRYLINTWRFVTTENEILYYFTTS